MKLIKTEDAVGHVLCARYHTDYQRRDVERSIPQRSYCDRRRYPGSVICWKRESLRLGKGRRHAA